MRVDNAMETIYGISNVSGEQLYDELIESITIFEEKNGNNYRKDLLDEASFLAETRIMASQVMHCYQAIINGIDSDLGNNEKVSLRDICNSYVNGFIMSIIEELENEEDSMYVSSASRGKSQREQAIADFIGMGVDVFPAMSDEEVMEIIKERFELQDLDTLTDFYDLPRMCQIIVEDSGYLNTLNYCVTDAVVNFAFRNSYTFNTAFFRWVIDSQEEQFLAEGLRRILESFVELIEYRVVNSDGYNETILIETTNTIEFLSQR